MSEDRQIVMLAVVIVAAWSSCSLASLPIEKQPNEEGAAGTRTRAPRAQEQEESGWLFLRPPRAC
jgi:hypothetical protein